MRLLILLLFLLAFQAGAAKPVAPESVPGTVTVTAEQTMDLMLTLSELLVIDSRRGDEYAKRHIDGAISLPDDDMTRESLLQVAPKQSTPLLFYCNGVHCLRSSQAAAKAISWGYQKVYWFRGGWLEWIEKSLPVAG